MRKTRRNSVSDDSTLHFKLTTFTFLFTYRADKRLITTLHSHTLSVHLELGGMQRLCHNLFTSRLLESLFCMHFSLYSLYILFSQNHFWLVCQIPSLQTAAGAHAEECGARGEVRTQERDSRGAAGHHLHDKMHLRSVDLIMIPGYYPSPLIRCWMSEQAEIVSVWWIVRHVLCQVRHVMMSDVTMTCSGRRRSVLSFLILTMARFTSRGETSRWVTMM